jgi:hypothetical protein
METALRLHGPPQEGVGPRRMPRTRLRRWKRRVLGEHVGVGKFEWRVLWEEGEKYKLARSNDAPALAISRGADWLLLESSGLLSSVRAELFGWCKKRWLLGRPAEGESEVEPGELAVAAAVLSDLDLDPKW